MAMKRWKTKLKLNFARKLLLFMVASVLAVCSVVFGYFVVNMRRQMESYALKELDFAMEQSTTQIQTGLDNLQSIMYTNLTDVQLWRRLSYEYEDTMDTWELYDYVNNFYATLLAMDDNIALVTIYVDNPTISEDKTYIRHYDFFKTLPVYEQVRADNGAVSLFAMKDVFPEEYYTYNTISNRDNFCLIRSFTYRGMDYGVVLEFSRDLFTDQLTTLHGHQTYLLNGAGEIAMYYDGSADRSGDVFGERFVDVVQDDSSRKRLGLGWQLVVPEQMELLKNVDQTILRMSLLMLAVILALVMLITQLLWRMTGRVRDLDATIRSTMDRYGGATGGVEEGGDEIDQALVSFNALKARIDYLMNEVMEKELAHRDAELRLLYSQIKPHFLYNTLSCVMSLARRYHDERLETMISSLSDIYRISLNRGRENITVEDEIQLTRSYLYIIQNRFDDMLQVTFETDPSIGPSVVPKVILQPFIENCVTHAILGDETLHISIRGLRQGEDVVFLVQDDGPGIAKETVDAIFDSGERGIGFGVRNVHQRIQMLYGNGYGVTLTNMPSGGTLAMLRLPFCLQGDLEALQKAGYYPKSNLIQQEEKQDVHHDD